MSKHHKEKSHGGHEQTLPSFETHPTHDELRAMGKALREKCPRASHAVWSPPHDRLDPVAHMEESSKGRMPQLIPIRHGRMIRSPFTFYRGAALNMAADLATTPTSGLRVQACGDCHLLNFGIYATPERRMVFDINDLDETLPAPWEWDVKRLAASLVLAHRSNGFSEAEARDSVLACVRDYRERMLELSEMSVLDVWYANDDVGTILASLKRKEARDRVKQRIERARERSVIEHDFPQLATTIGVRPAIKDNPPLIFHPKDRTREEYEAIVEKAFTEYRLTLPEHRRQLLDRYKYMDIAIKVVGIGSVGTFCSVMLLMASASDPLFLQVKQARASVLEPYAGKSAFANHGQRVVIGQQLMQSASDLFLGWTEGREGRHFYIRQLKDMKIKPMVEIMDTEALAGYASICGRALARAHARSGEPAKISGYLGKSDAFDEAIADFAKAYADQSERDHEVLVRAVRSGTLEVMLEDD